MKVIAMLAAVMLLASCTSAGDSAPDEPAAATSPSPSESVVPSPTETSGLAAYYQQELRWTDCMGGFECTELRVPRDYADPRGIDDLRLEVIRLPASGGSPIGSLVVNPGGPGGSGVDYARAARSIVSQQIQDSYDVVGFDPRGVGSSQPVECLTDSELDTLIGTDPTPDDEAEVEQLFTEAGRVGSQCERRSPAIYRWMDTVSSAKDMDVLRAALGDEQLNYLGKSYGTALGSVYAEQFPANVGRFVLDGALPVDLSSEEISRGQAAGFELALQRFVDNCLGHSGCPLKSMVTSDGVAEIRSFLAGLDAAPIKGSGDRDLTEALGVTAVLYYLYSPPNDWALLRDGLAAAFNGDGSVLVDMLDRRLQRDPESGKYANNTQEAFYAVSCLDRSAATVDQIEANATSWAAESPTFGPYLAWSDAVCAQWPTPPVTEPRTIAAEGSGPILVVSTQFDPATPYEWGPRMADGFANAALVSWNGDGHTAYRHGSDCVDGAVDTYLLTGQVPTTDPRCGY